MAVGVLHLDYSCLKTDSLNLEGHLLGYTEYLVISLISDGPDKYSHLLCAIMRKN